MSANLSIDPCTPEGIDHYLDMQTKMETALQQRYGSPSSAPTTTFRSFMTTSGTQSHTNDNGTSPTM